MSKLEKVLNGIEDVETGVDDYTAEPVLTGVNQQDKPEEELVSAILQESTKPQSAPGDRNPTLFLGLGGTGLKTLDRLKRILIESDKKRRLPAGYAFLAFDCDRNDIASLKYLHQDTEAYHIGIENPKEWYQANRQNPWCDFVTQSKFPANALDGAGQYRQIGRMCLFDHYDTCRTALHDTITQILPLSEKTGPVKLEVFMVNSICGGAGSGTFIDMAILLRELSRTASWDISITAMIVTGDVYRNRKHVSRSEEDQYIANTYACMRDINYLQDRNSPHLDQQKDDPLVIRYPDDQIKLSDRLFDLILLIQGSNEKGKPTLQSVPQLVQFLSSSIFLMSTAPLSANRESRWINRTSGFQLTDQFHKGAPRVFSSLGYVRFTYPEDQVINFLHTRYGELVLENLLDAIPMKVEKVIADDPKINSINDFIQMIVADEIKDGFEFEDLRTEYMRQLSDKMYDQDSLVPVFAEIAKKEVWNQIGEKFQAEISEQIESVKDRGFAIENTKNALLGKFDRFWENLPLELIRNRIGLNFLEMYADCMLKEVAREEVKAVRACEENDRQLKANNEDWKQNQSEINGLLKDKPLLFEYGSRKRLLSKSGELSRELSEYLNDLLMDMVLDASKETLTKFKSVISERTRQARDVVTKFGTARDLYANTRYLAQEELRRIADRLNAFHHHSEFSIVDMEQIEAFETEILNKNKPDKLAMSLFGQLENDVPVLWDYANPAIKPQDTVKLISNQIKTFMKPYRLTLGKLADKINLDRDQLKSSLEARKDNMAIQWNINRHDALCKPKYTASIAYPASFKLDDGSDIRSSSEQNIEMLRLGFGMPAHLLNGIDVWREKYDKVNSETKTDELHNIPQAVGWPNVNEPPKNEDQVTIFALGLAYGHMLDPTEEEAQAIKKKYRTDYRNFIFSRGNTYFLMPFYPQPQKPGEKIQAADMKKVVRLGNSREKALDNFLRHPEWADTIKMWVHSRVMDLSYVQVTDMLEGYRNDVLTDLINSSSENLKNLAERENKCLEAYIKQARRDKSLELL
jgi:hypothetical protein